MKTALVAHSKEFDPQAPGGFSSKRALLETTWDWFPLQAALILGAIWHAKAQSQNPLHVAAMRETYGSVASTLCGMLHRLGDMVPYIDGDGLKAERERNPVWKKEGGLNQVVIDISDWATTGTPRYRAQAWEPQWGPLRQARIRLEGFGGRADSLLFNAVLDVEALQTDQSAMSLGARHGALIALCDKAAELFDQMTHTRFMVMPIRQMAAFLRAGEGSFELHYALTRVADA